MSSAAEEPFYERAPTWGELSPVLEVGVTLLIAAVGAVWAFTKYLDQRRKEAQERNTLEENRLDQLRREEANRRAERASELVLKFDQSEDSDANWLTASAMALYPDQLMPVLITALSRAQPKTAWAITTALASVGEPAVEPLVRANRMASSLKRHQISADASPVRDPEQLLSSSRSALAQIIMLHLTEVDLEEIDLADVDLSGMSFADARLAHANFRKSVLAGCNFSGAVLHDAIFRGAVVSNVSFTEARANRVDFTGMTGRTSMIRLHANAAIFDYARIDESDLQGASLVNAKMRGTRLRRAVVSGANFESARFENTCRLDGLVGRKSRFEGATFDQCHLGSADLSEARLKDATFRGCLLGGADLSSAFAEGAIFEQCKIGGVSFVGSVLAGTIFRRSQLGGTKFEKANLAGASFIECDLSGFDFAGADLTGVSFIGEIRFRASDLDSANHSWRNASFDPSSRRLQAAFGEVGR